MLAAGLIAGEPQFQLTPAWGREPVVEASTTRQEIVLNGLWRFIPNDGMKPVDPPAAGWGWIRVPGSWRSGGWPSVYSGLASKGDAPVWKVFDAKNGRGDEVYAAWYERELALPVGWQGRRIVLDLNRVSTDATVWLDGVEAGRAAWPTGRIDLTAAAKPGTTQRLRVLVYASAGAAEFATFMGTATEQVTRSKAEVRARGLIGDVIVTALPQGPEISEVFAKPEVEGGTALGIEATVDGVATAGPATLVARLTDNAGALVRELRQEIRLETATRQTVTARWPVPEAKLWDLLQPNLYVVDIGIDGAGIADHHRVRFGFRQFRVDGRGFRLNGTPITLRPCLDNIEANGGVTFPSEARRGFAWRLSQGYNLTELWPGSIQRRGTEDYQEVPATVADEMGWLITGMLPHLGDFISGKGLDADGVRAQLAPYRRLRNHPSIIMWGSSGNYFGHKTDQDPINIGRRGFADADPEFLKRKRLGEQGLAIYKAMDPTRPQFIHHGADVGDLHTCNNYLNMMPLQEREGWLSRWTVDGTMPFWPVEFETPVSLSFMRDRNGHDKADTSEPFLSEYAAGVLGERAYALEPAAYRKAMLDGYEGKNRWRFRSVRMGDTPAFQEIQVLNQRRIWRSWRALGATILPLPWDDAYTHGSGKKTEVPMEPWIPGQRFPWQPLRRDDPRPPKPAADALGAHHPEGAGGPTLACIVHVPGGGPRDLIAKDHHLVPGQVLCKTALLINDERTTQAWSASWRLKAGDRVIAEGSAQGELPPAGRHHLPITATAPDATGDLLLELTARIGAREHADRLALRVHAPAHGTGQVLVADPGGWTTKALADLGFACTPWDGAPAPGAVVVIGRHALRDAGVRALDIRPHLAAGGRVVVMAQDRTWYEREQGLRTAQWTSRQVFPVPTMASHPAIAGLDAEDLRDWNGAGTGLPPEPSAVATKESNNYPPYGWKWGNEGSVCGLAIEKPHRGSWRPLLQCEFDLAYAPLLEQQSGTGLLVWNTLDLEGRTAGDPVASRILAQVITHARTWRPEAERTAAAMLGDAGFVGGLDLAAEPATGLPADLRPVIIAADAQIDDAALEAWIARGGRALVRVGPGQQRLGHRATEAKAHLGSLTPPAWPECRGLAAGDLRLRGPVDLQILSGPGAGADGLLARVAIGTGVAILTTIDPASLPADRAPWLRRSQWNMTRALALVAANLGIASRSDGKAQLIDLSSSAPVALAGPWQMQVERDTPPPAGDAAPAEARTDGTWLPIRQPGTWESQPAQFDGATWFRRSVDIPADWAGQELVLELGPVDDHDRTWFDGQPVGGIGSENPDAWRNPRNYRIPAERVRGGKASIAIRVWDWFGGGSVGSIDPAQPAPMRLRRKDGQGQPIALDGAWLARSELQVPPAKSPGAFPDPGIAAHAATWHEAGLDDAGWRPVRLPSGIEEAMADIDGVVWLRRTATIPQAWIGRPLELHLGRIDDAGAVYVGGRRISDRALRGTIPVPAEAVTAAELPIAVRVIDRSGPGGLIGGDEDLRLSLPGDVAGLPWYAPGWIADFNTGDNPFRYYRW